MGLLHKIINIVYRKRNPPAWMALRRTTPFEPDFGCNRGTPIDRYYIEQFLAVHQSHIKGTVIEIGDDVYTKKFGQSVTKSEVLHYDNSSPKATIIGDLSKPENLPAGIADCFICTQTLNFIFDYNSAIKGIRHLLKENGVALVTVAGLCQISKYDYDRWGDFWRFTEQSIRKIMEQHFDPAQLEISSYGNVLAATSLLHGITVEDLTKAELDIRDEVYQVVISVVAKNKKA